MVNPIGSMEGLEAEAAEHAASLKSEWRRGVRAAMPIAMGYFPIAVTFGLLAKSSGLGFGISILMSLFVYSGASQFLTVGMLAAGTPFIAVVAANLILNLRHVVMSTSLARRYRLEKRLPAAIVSFGITDETFVVASNEKSPFVSTGFLFGLNATAYASWAAGTAAGAVFTAWIPEDLAASMGVALYAMFIALLVPSMKKSRNVTAVAITGAALSWVFSLPLGPGWSIVPATLLAALFGMILDRRKGNGA